MEAILEHVPNPLQVLAESDRVLKPGGWLYCEVPFLQGEHAAPGDYRRWTQEGLLQMFHSWRVDWIEAASGPFSALAYQLRSCLAIMTSFGSDFLYRILFEAVWGYVVWPIKFLDACFGWHPRSQSHAFGYALMVRRK
jgi:SAM-dependent methyltransferase